MEAILALEDGRAFRGRAFGTQAEQSGEVVFNTSMTGYQEILTDPSYRGQIVVMTYPQIGNYGTNTEDSESDLPQAGGMVVRELSQSPSNWRATQSLHLYLSNNGIPGISDVDTRAITRHIRTAGAMRGIVSSVDRDVESLVLKARSAPMLKDIDLVADVTCRSQKAWSSQRPERWRNGDTAGNDGGPKCVAFDFGIKRTILNLLVETGFDVTVVPASCSAQDVLAMEPDAVFLSNGPGDPEVPAYAIETVRSLIGRKPMFGICLGHQIAALALGAKTYKLKFGHRGGNHPVMDLSSGKVEITAQNHGYAVDPDTLPKGSEVTHVNLNDRTCEGFVLPELRLMAVQYHPEASPGPHDSMGLFQRFRSMVAEASR